MKYTKILPCLGLLALGTAHAQQAPVAKPGTVGPVTLQATLVGQGPTTTVGNRTVYTTVTTRFGNRELLESIRETVLKDTTINGWSIVRLADASAVGNLYATKKGKATVAIPASAITQPVVTGQARAGSVITQSANLQTYNLITKVYGTSSIRGGLATVSGVHNHKSAVFKSGTTSTAVVARTENVAIIGQAPLANGATTSTGTVNASYRINRATPANIAPLLPANAQ